MKNALQYYYGLVTTNIHQFHKRYLFRVDKDNYVFMPCERNIEELKELYQISNLLIRNGIYSHEIILNNSGSMITFINQIPYILMKTRVKQDDIIILSDLIFFQNKTKNMNNSPLLRRNDWYALWTNKVDYFEYQVSQLSKKYPRIRESFSYFIGLAETSISLYKMLSKKDAVSLCIAHKRIRAKDTLFDLYNPLNFILDIPSRDASEYFKSAFMDQDDIINEIIYYLSYSNLNEYECQMFFVRLLFPTFYFDIYEDVITGDEKEKELLKATVHIEKYEQMLKQVYQYLRTIIYLPEIEWLSKVSAHY